MYGDLNNIKMQKEEIIEIIERNKKEIEKFGVKKIGIFGSLSRGEAKEKSDIDLIVEFQPNMATFKNFGGLVEYLERLLGKSIDILTPAGVESIRINEIKESIRRDIIYV